ncbi:MAG TPA: hypothetical protein DCQ29_07975 [Chitinophagaceae bacterium]|nr:hypothetical protein [Chitinophagaceae bacterium]
MRCKAIALIWACCSIYASNAQQRTYYKEPTWQPRAVLPYKDAIHDNFWPKSPNVTVDYNDPNFDDTRLSQVPAPGIHPRVLVTPSDVEAIRAKVALGDKAPMHFRTMWERVKKLQSPFYALVTKNDSLGRKMALELVQKIKDLEPKIEAMDQRPDRDNLWAVERSIVASNDPNPPTEIWELLDYDYLHYWMTEEERSLARKIIAKIIRERISNFIMVPDHFMINNHEGFGMEYIRLMLLIEGEEGFDEALFNLAVKKCDAMLSWYLTKDGICYESIKGWLNVSAFVAVGMRERKLLKHSHLRAKINYFLAATRWEDGSWKIRDEMRASAFHVIWMMKYFHPKDERLDFLHSATFTTHPFLLDASVKWPDPVGICNELLLLFAENGLTDTSGKVINWNLQANIDRLKLPLTLHDSTRGYVEVRNSWKKEDLKVGFVCKQDFYYGGHEGSENNRLTIWKDGVNWVQDNNMLATKATFLQNMLTVDGMGCHWPPVAGNWLGMQESNIGVTAAGDGKMGYSFYKIMQVHPLAFPSAKIPYYQPFTEGNFDLSRDLQIAFQPSTIAWNDGYAHTDYGPWSGETRLVESYKPFNTMQQAYRTVHVAKGKYPYVLVFDDAKKDEQEHQFDFNLSVPIDAELVEAITPEIVFQNSEPSLNRMSDIILSKGPVLRDATTGKAILKKGQPLCLIRVLWRNTTYGFPVPRLEKFQGYSLVTIPAKSVSPEFRILIYPYQHGDPIPQTNWNTQRTTLTVDFKEVQDVYQLAQSDGGRTVLAMQRNNSKHHSHATPSAPTIQIRSHTYQPSDFRYTRLANKIPTYLIHDSLTVNMKYPDDGAIIRYTLDGSTPTETSEIYTYPIIIKNSSTLKAATFNTNWIQGKQQSTTTTVIFESKKAATAIIPPTNATNGLTVSVYEINTKLYNDKGFFVADKIMLPDVRNYKPILTTTLTNFKLPAVTPQQPLEQQSKGFYAFKGWFYASQTAVYTFHVHSCGPILMEVGNQTAIEHIGVFHQQLADRSGEVVLQKGWHAIALTICDPLFWNINSLPEMPFTVRYQINDGSIQNINDAQLKTIGTKTTTAPINLQKATVLNTMLEPGFVLSTYDRIGKRRDADFLDIDTTEPTFQAKSNQLEAANSRNNVRVYDGYFFAPMSGAYQFNMPYRVGDNAGLGATQASCQSQLRINNNIILQRGVYGRNLNGIAHLQTGWHRISMRFGTGEATCTVTMPNQQTIRLTANSIYREATVSIVPKGITTNGSNCEFFDSVQVVLQFEKDKDAIIKYTTDGSIPTSNALTYNGRITLNNNTTIRAVAIKNNNIISAVANMQFKKVLAPEYGSLGYVAFDQWNGDANVNTNANYNVWLAPGSSITNGLKEKAALVQSTTSLLSKSVDINVARGATIKPGMKLYNINMRENALTVTLWFKTDALNGKLFSKEGINAFGKSYRTIYCQLNNGRLQGPRVSGGTITPSKWHFVVLSASEQKVTLYLDGMQVATGNGTKDIMTDALDFFTGCNGTVQAVQLFDRYLQLDEVKKLYQQTKQ